MKVPLLGATGFVGTAIFNELEFCTVAHWKDGEIVEEKLFYDLVGLLPQIGVMTNPGAEKAASRTSSRTRINLKGNAACCHWSD
jgi:hypothetical protein